MSIRSFQNSINSALLDNELGSSDGSEEHLAAMRALGPSPQHRKSFSPMREMLSGQPSLF